MTRREFYRGLGGATLRDGDILATSVMPRWLRWAAIQEAWRHAEALESGCASFASSHETGKPQAQTPQCARPRG